MKAFFELTELLKTPLWPPWSALSMNFNVFIYNFYFLGLFALLEGQLATSC